MGLQKFRKNILKATHNLEFLAVLVFPDSSITLDTRMSNLDIRMSKLIMNLFTQSAILLCYITYILFGCLHFQSAFKCSCDIFSPVMCKLFQTVQWVLKISIHAYTSLTSKTESEKKKFPSQPGEENRAQIRTIFRLKKFTAYENFIIKKYWVSKSYVLFNSAKIQVQH